MLKIFGQLAQYITGNGRRVDCSTPKGDFPMGEVISLADVEAAQKLIAEHLKPTPLSYSPVFSDMFGREVYFKWESKLRSGAFKERGAVNFLLNLSPEERKAGVCAASAGNHARALSLHAQRLGIKCTIFMPKIAPLIKIQACEKNGATVRLEGETFDESLSLALAHAKDNNLVFIHPFNHRLIMAGQGTCGLEILEQCPDMDAVIVPIGGGGLLSGIATAVKAKKPECFVMGVKSEWAYSYQIGKPKPSFETTIADGIAVKRIGELTGQVIDKKVDSIMTVNEAEIRKSVVHLLELEKAVVEGGGGVGLCALMANKIPEKYRKIVVVISGGNIDMNLISSVIQRDLVERGRILRFSINVPDRPGLLNKVTSVIAKRSGNVLDVAHDRFPCNPGAVEIAFVVEVRDRNHGEEITKELEEQGITVVKREI
jgi:threonine dehydratase